MENYSLTPESSALLSLQQPGASWDSCPQPSSAGDNYSCMSRLGSYGGGVLDLVGDK